MVGAGGTLEEAGRVLLLRGGFNTSVVIVGTTLLGLAAGVVGVFALLRKRSLVTDALSHATLPGIAMVFIAATLAGADGKSLPALLAGGALSGVAGVLTIQAIVRHTRLREDAAIGAVLSVFFGAGVVALSFIQEQMPAGSAGLNRFIFGQAAAMSAGDAGLMAAIAAGAIVAACLLRKEFEVVCFNDAFARVDGWPVSLIDLLMMAMVVVVTVAGLQAVGLLLVVALLIVPPVAARFWTERLGPLLAISGGVGALSGYLGSAASAVLPDHPTGAVIVLTSGAVFAVSMTAAPARGVVASALRRARFRLRMEGDHVVEDAHERGVLTLDRRGLATLARTRGWSRAFGAAVLWSLARRGLVRGVEGGGVALTDAGVDRGARVSRNHALWEQYLISYADVAPSHVDWSVDQVEHVLSEPLVRRLEARLAERGVVVPAAGRREEA